MVHFENADPEPYTASPDQSPQDAEALAAKLTRLGWVAVPPDPSQEDEEPRGITPDQLEIAAAYIRRFGTEDFELGGWAAERLADVLRWAIDADAQVADYEAYAIAQGEVRTIILGGNDDD